MTTLIPIMGSKGDSLCQVIGARKSPPFERQGAQRFPPGFDQVQPGGIGWLKEKANAGMGQCPQLNIQSTMNRQIVQDQDHCALRPGSDQEIEKSDKVMPGTLQRRLRDDHPRDGFQSAEDPQLGIMAAIIGRDLGTVRLRRPVGTWVRAHPQGTHLVHAHHLGLGRRLLVHRYDRPLFPQTAGRAVR